MLLKTIYCKVEEEKKELFSKAQEKWQDIQYLDGFHGQFGGWHEDEACVFTLWEDKSAYQSFMNGAHDTIYINSNQEDTFLSCEIELFQTLYDITDTRLKYVVTEGSFVRAAICDVKVEKEKYFLHKQETIWNKGMEKTRGMLGGVVAKSLKNKNRYIVLTYWKDEITHQHYVEEIFPELYKLANIHEDIEDIRGKEAVCKEEWLVY
ncbi:MULTISPECIES: YdbC family protein [Bacillus]|uniref:YdbC family protein n=1 Tax=Bacillus TaxID=1386 RepID=UPI000943C755|nr:MULTISPECIES: YdbC family protein [Bacillus cereus group]MDA1545901.1 YdbC family protein [Bacillus cereus group sp. TH253LC]MDA1577029.1 YdbC family protein [Bacillus cereus group sp. TH228LC]MDA1628566.1 YdbC family protein [Bacillus cereus group sp. TH172LC]MDA1830568.1 YdbC family protein [Bacillus cereus group sp. BY142LC]MDA1835624.1 YdbC family protein [Bacillus cereus group sp. BY17LC]